MLIWSDLNVKSLGLGTKNQKKKKKKFSKNSNYFHDIWYY